MKSRGTMSHLTSLLGRWFGAKRSGRHLQGEAWKSANGKDGYAPWKSRRRAPDRKTGAVAKLRHKEAEKRSSLEKAGHRNICCRADVRHNFADIAVPLARTR